MKLLGLVGTNSARSTNRKLLQYIEQHFADKADIELVEIKELPIFNKPANREHQKLSKNWSQKLRLLTESSSELPNMTTLFQLSL